VRPVGHRTGHPYAPDRQPQDERRTGQDRKAAGQNRGDWSASTWRKRWKKRKVTFFHETVAPFDSTRGNSLSL